METMTNCACEGRRDFTDMRVVRLSSNYDRPIHEGMDGAVVPVCAGGREHPLDGVVGVVAGDVRRRSRVLGIEEDVVRDRLECEGHVLACIDRHRARRKCEAGDRVDGARWWRIAA